MKEKPYRVTMTYLKNVAKRHRPPVYEEQSKMRHSGDLALKTLSVSATLATAIR